MHMDEISKTEYPEISPGELRILKFLTGSPEIRKPIPENSISIENMDEREISSSISWLASKGLILIEKNEKTFYELTEEGRRFLDEGLPEEQVYLLLEKEGQLTIPRIIGIFGEKYAKIAMAQLAKLNIKPVKGTISLQGIAGIGEVFIKRKRFLESVKEGNVFPDPQLLEHFRKREDVLSERKKTLRSVLLTEKGRLIAERNELKDTIAEITPEILRTGAWKNSEFRKYDITSPVEKIYAASLHPITFLIEKVRRIFLDMGFTEMDGHYIEYSGWNMDALYIPQDHPARDMQDTFYLNTKESIDFEHPEVLDIFRKTHEKGMKGYTGWGYKWDLKKAKQMVLRTHTTVSTIRYLYEHQESPQAVFSVEKVFRHESVDWKHLAELHQIEGAYYGKDASLSSLKWLMKEFYARLGFTDLKFIPSYYPYTEPSMDVVVRINGKEMELGGSGVFRPEVTRPLGLKEPVVAWGLGLERLAMIYYGLDDIRKIYQSDIDWLRNFVIKS
ncbi:MAG: phenylalanine--tRNA ligase subunit alpha [Candidatus Thermoplasmatota archaeon]|nr:phenylalanine--tRNA ligase subunit alpha [Candidatus Thermoplasmatota archaeon]